MKLTSTIPTPAGRQPGLGGEDFPLTSDLSELLVRASWRLRRNERKELAPFGLTFAQARALRVLSSASEGVRIGELAETLEIVPRSATTMVDGLESAGLAARRMDPADRRSVLVSCTAEGDALLSRLAEGRRAAAEVLFSPLTQEEKKDLLGLLRSLIEGR
jgi:DNA-binding MarR family transcriptional regulator